MDHIADTNLNTLIKNSIVINEGMEGKNMGLKDLFNKSKAEEKVNTAAKENANVTSEADYLDDTSYVVRFEHTEQNGWHLYTLQMTGGYGWEYMISSADYVKSVDFLDLQQVSYSMIAGAQEIDITKLFKNTNMKFAECKELENERGILSMAGVSKHAGIPVKIVWFNQTQILRFITPINDEIRIKKYAESLIRRNFGTPDSMKMGRPINPTAQQ